MSRSLLLLLLLAPSVACASGSLGQSDSTADTMVTQLGTLLVVPSLAGLDSVRLGMEAAQLVRIRGAAQPSPYIGLAEVIGPDTVRYRFPQGTATSLEAYISIESIPPDADARLLAVEAWTAVDSTETADGIWRTRAARLASAKADVARCFRYMHGQTPSVAAIASEGDVTVGVLRYPREIHGSIAGPVITSAIVSTFITNDLSLFIPSDAARADMTCPR